MDSILEINDLTKRYDTFTLDGISMRLDEGFIMGLVGPNGAGKTTLIKLILSLLRKDSGKISIFGMDATDKEDHIKQQLGFVLDESSWYDDLRVREMAAVISPFYVDWNSTIFNDYLNRFGIFTDQRIGTLSKGMKMKFSLAVALSHNARLIIMDEPTSGLDPIIRDEVLDMLQEIIREGDRSILFSSHISSDVDKIADYITFINDGKIVFSESREFIKDTYHIIKGPLEYLDRDTSRFFVGIRKKQHTFSAITTRSNMVLKDFGRYLNSGKMIMEPASIDEIMLHTIKGENYDQPSV